MNVKLKVLTGSSAGKELSIRKRKFVIGRAEDCHLRARNDALSRHHCVIIVRDELVVVRDLKSRNGTQVNGQAILKDFRLKSGDRLSLGPLEFEVLITVPSKKTIAPQSDDLILQTRKSRTTADVEQNDDGDVGGWLDEADDMEDIAKVTRSSETRIFHLAEKDQAELKETAEQRQKKSKQDLDDVKKKKPPNSSMSPVSSDLTSATNSQDAATQMLAKMFNRRQ